MFATKEQNITDIDFVLKCIIGEQAARSWGTVGPAAFARAGSPTLAGSHNIRYFIAKSFLSRFTRFLGVPFSAIQCEYY